ncbi:cytidylate kinase [gamma proteobacterium HTCC5015]|nr:cytidylate kinase [gamma proteobacterium HTCC5015]
MTSTMAPVITVDGPSGAGKGTLCQWLAQQLGWHLLDSGALYRLTALSAIKTQTDLADHAALGELARNLDVVFDAEGSDGVKTLLEGEDVSRQLRTEDTGAVASQVAAVPEVRAALLERQRSFSTAPGLVADGRDMGTVVFVEAPLKIFLTASAEERAQRRHKQLIDKGFSANLGDLLRDIQARDERDRNRSSSPLVPAEDAIELDTTSMPIEAVCRKVYQLARERNLVADNK